MRSLSSPALTVTVRAVDQVDAVNVTADCALSVASSASTVTSVPDVPVTVTVTFPVGCFASFTVNVPEPPSATFRLVFDSTSTERAVTATSNSWAVPDGSAPPPTLVPKLDTSKPLAPVPSGPSATSIVLPAADAFTVSSSVATCTVSVA